MIEITCVSCKNKFATYPSRRNSKKYCSFDCRKTSSIITCDTCGVKFKRQPHAIRKKANYCSKDCRDKNNLHRQKGESHYNYGKKRPGVGGGKNGQKAWNKGEKMPEIQGENNHNWKGDNASVKTLHKWVKRHRGKPEKCEHCGKSGLKGQEIHWANKDHKYRRKLDDWMRLCVDCHTEYDIEHNGKYLKKQYG